MNQEKYYTNDGVTPTDANWGTYQNVTLGDVVNNFILMYTDDGDLLNNINRYKVLFHAKRAVQELNYDGNRQTNALQLEVGHDLKFVLPPDYVNYVRVSLFWGGNLYPMTENPQANSSIEFLQDDEYQILFDDQGNALQGTSKLDLSRIDGVNYMLCPFNNQWGWYVDGLWYFTWGFGAAFGLNTEVANVNPTFRVDKAAGVINFSSGMFNRSVVLEYISDGLYPGDDNEIVINKLAEEYIYSYIKWAILNTKANQPEYIINRARKEKVSNWRNAKIRLSNLHPGRLLMSMRGQSKWIK
jgi:hypothetical protein